MQISKLKVFIACPYTKGNIGLNVKRCMHVGNRLINGGFVPFIPLLYHFQNINYPQDEKVWLEQDKEWLLSCDALYRMYGDSSGADVEVKFAKENKIPVFMEIGDLKEWKVQREQIDTQWEHTHSTHQKLLSQTTSTVSGRTWENLKSLRTQYKSTGNFNLLLLTEILNSLPEGED